VHGVEEMDSHAPPHCGALHRTAVRTTTAQLKHNYVAPTPFTFVLDYVQT
jgi:hypothetical protein